MADDGKTERLYSQWREAEAEYAAVLATFGGEGPPAKITKSAALELSRSRGKADSARDKYFRRALK